MTRSTRAALLMGPVSNAATMVLNFGTILVAAGLGQGGAIAGYSAGIAIAVLTAVISGGGTTLAYATGSQTTKSAVVSVRGRIVLPALLLTGVAASLLYSGLTPIRFQFVLFGVLAGTFANLSELQVSRHQSQLRNDLILYTSVGSRLVGLALVLAGVNFALAMAILNALYLFCLTALRADNRPRAARSLKRSVMIAYRPSLIAATFSDAIVTRLPLLVAPFLFTDLIAADAFATIFTAATAIQSISGAALNTLLNVHSSTGKRPDWANKLEQYSIGATAIALIVAIAIAPLAPLALGAEKAQYWWILASSAAPLATWNRTRQYRYMAGKNFLPATHIVATTATVTLIGVGASLAIGNDLLLASVNALAHLLEATLLGPLRRAIRNSK